MCVWWPKESQVIDGFSLDICYLVIENSKELRDLQTEIWVIRKT